MLTRRQLLARGATLFVLVPVVGCSSSSDPPPPSGGSCSGTIALSSKDALHTHTVCILNSDMATPPAGGVMYTTSDEGGHTHKIMLSQANLTSLGGGQTVTTTSSNDVDQINGVAHTHTFAITKGNNTGSGGGGGGGDPGGW
jgi:hypothetical protein